MIQLRDKRQPYSTNGADSEGSLNVTVVICTYNRSKILATTLSSVAASQLPAQIRWEVLVVDNNSSDGTRKVVEEFCNCHPGRFRYVFEAIQGLSHARNSGIRHARGEIIAFTDDDVIVEPTWLWNLTCSLASDRWVGAGGRILPTDNFSPPRWLVLDGPRSMAGALYAHFDLGDKLRRLDRPPYGANMAYRKAIFQKYGDFRTDLGRCGDSLISNEDTEFGGRLIAAGESLLYEPSAKVYHPVPESRLRKDYFLAWWFDAGRARVREAGRRQAVCGISRHYLRIPRVILFHLPKLVFQWISALDEQQRFIRKCWVWTTFGEISEMFRLGKQAAPSQVSKVEPSLRTR